MRNCWKQLGGKELKNKKSPPALEQGELNSEWQENREGHVNEETSSWLKERKGETSSHQCSYESSLRTNYMKAKIDKW